MSNGSAGSCIYAGVGRWRSGEMSGLFRLHEGNGGWQKLDDGLPAKHIQNVTVHPGIPNVVFAGTEDGLYRSDNGGDSWRRLPLADTPIQVWSVLVHPAKPRTIFVGTAPAAVFRSDDGGETWRRLSWPDDPPRVDMGFPCRLMRLAADAAQPSHLYAALEVNGVMRSRDEGETWEDCNDDLMRLSELPHLRNKVVTQSEAEGILDGHAICVAGGGKSHVFLANRMGLFRSDDGGSTWQDLEVIKLASLRYGRDIRISPHDPHTIYLCLGQGAMSKKGVLYRSRDLGRTWEGFDLGADPNSTMMGVAFDPREPDRFCCGTREGQIFRTRDGGKSFTLYQLPPGCTDVYSLACA